MTVYTRDYKKTLKEIRKLPSGYYSYYYLSGDRDPVAVEEQEPQPITEKLLRNMAWHYCDYLDHGGESVKLSDFSSQASFLNWLLDRQLDIAFMPAPAMISFSDEAYQEAQAAYEERKRQKKEARERKKKAAADRKKKWAWSIFWIAVLVMLVIAGLLLI